MKPQFVFVHGAHHDGWCWTPVLERLDRRGLPGMAVDLPLTSFSDDVDCVREATVTAGRRGPVVLVAHSYGGLPVAAGGHLAEQLVFVAARMPQTRESPAALTRQWTDPRFRRTQDTDRHGVTRLRPDAAALLYSASPANLATRLAARWRPMSSQVPAAAVTDPAWHSVPSTYIVCAQDRAVLPAAQRACAARAGTTVEIVCDHSPFLSAPDRLVEVVVEAAARIPGWPAAH